MILLYICMHGCMYIHDIVLLCLNFECMQPAVICEDYPADNYTLVVNSSMFEPDLQESVSVPQDGDKEMIEISIDLAENDVFTVKVLATNSFGTATTEEMTICEFALSVSFLPEPLELIIVQTIHISSLTIIIIFVVSIIDLILF